MSKISCLILIGCFLVCPSPKLFSFNANIDSLLNVLQTEFADMPLVGKAKHLHHTGIAYYRSEQHSEAEKYFRQSLQLSIEGKLKRLVMDNYYYLGVVQFWQSGYVESVRSLQQGLDVFPEILSTEDSIYIIDQMGASYFYMGDLDLSLECRLKSFHLAQMVADSTFLAGSLYALAEVEMEQKEFDQALKYVQQSLDISTRADDDYYVSYCLDLIGNIYHETKNFAKAIEYKTKSCETVDTIVEAYQSAFCDYTLALTYNEMGDFEKAIALFSSALAKQQASDQQEDAARSMAYLGALLAKEGDCQKGMDMLLQSLAIAEQLVIKPLYRDVYEKLYATTKHCGRFEDAVGFQEKYILYRDSISNSHVQMRIANQHAKHELNMLELNLLQKDQRLSTLYIVLLCVALAFFFLLATFVFWLYKKQQSDNRLQAERSATLATHNVALESTNQQLKHAYAELEQFAYIISHDLKAPLRTIGSYASLINRRYKDNLDEDGRNFLRYITEDAKHMSTLLENILDYSKVDKSEEVFEKVDLNLSMERAMRQLDGTIRKINATIVYPSLPTVKGNKTQLLQVFQNLIDNALKFIPADHQPHIQIAVVEEPNHFRFSVQDNGIGIPPEMQSKIFAPFKRLHNRNEYQGTGIGLAICQKIVERHGGKIWVESDGATGTTFYFTIGK